MRAAASSSTPTWAMGRVTRTGLEPAAVEASSPIAGHRRPASRSVTVANCVHRIVTDWCTSWPASTWTGNGSDNGVL